MSDKHYDLSHLDITGEVEANSGNFLGDAHELFVASILMRLGVECAIVEYSSSPYDLILSGYDRNPINHEGAEKKFLKAQVKTADGKISLTGGSRGGVDRDYVSDEKVYTYTSDTVDLIIGVDKRTLDMYLLPAIFVDSDKFGKSKSLSKLEPLRNRWDLFLNWRPENLETVKQELPDFQ